MLEILIKRRSVRKYKSNKVSKEDIDLLIKAALLAPSSRGLNPWSFIVVTDETLIEKLSHAKQHGSELLNGAPLGIVVIADEKINDVWVEDASIASIIIQLQAESMGLGSCWVQIRNRMHNQTKTSEDYVRELLDIPNNYRVESIIAIGYPDQAKRPHLEEELEYKKVYLDKFNNSFRL